jgi:hypothetical protein
MTQMNVQRIVVGGLLAGLVMNVIDGVANAVVLGGRWASEANALNPDLMKKAAASSTVGWIVTDFVLGIALVWVYAAIRPRFGAGPATAMKAALAVWVVGHLFFFSYAFNGLYSAALIGACSLAGLVAALAGGYVGGLMYRE